MKSRIKNPLYFVLAANVSVHVWRFLVKLAGWGYGLGFTSDDAWIHLNFGRNVARHLEFSYTPGIPSTGSTSPLWSVICSIPHFICDSPAFAFAAVTVICSVLFFLSAVAVYRITKKMFKHELAGWAAALVFVNEWHMIWAALSGMEIMLFIFIELVLIEHVLYKEYKPVTTGVLGGLLFLARPEGVLLFAAALIYRTVGDLRTHGLDAWKNLLRAALPALALAAPVLAFYVAVDGSLMPSTFEAKRNFYMISSTRGAEIPAFLGAFARLLTGPQAVFLLPATMLAFFQLLLNLFTRGKLEPWWIIAVWIILFVGAYCWNLPKAFQRQRYLMPMIPLLATVGAGFTFAVFRRLDARDVVTMLATLVAAATAVLLFPPPAGSPLDAKSLIVPVLLVSAMGVIRIIKIHAPGLAERPVPFIGGGGETAEDGESGEIIPGTIAGFTRTVLALTLVLLCLTSSWSKIYVTKDVNNARRYSGLDTYVGDVLFINEQHVQAGKWLRENTPPNTVVATHDIGAVAYFSERPVLDMVGLVTPQLIPYVHYHSRMFQILLGRDEMSEKIIRPYRGRTGRAGADYMAVFTTLGVGFFEDLQYRRELEPVFWSGTRPWREGLINGVPESRRGGHVFKVFRLPD